MEYYCIKNRKHAAQFFEDFKTFDFEFFDNKAKLIVPDKGVDKSNIISPLGTEFVHLYVVDIRIHTITHSKANVIVIRSNSLESHEFDNKTIKIKDNE